MLDYALRYAALGWHVFPVWGAKDGKCRCMRQCKSPGKHPVEHIVPRGQNDATTDPATIRRWWAQMPHAGIGVFLQPSGLVGIDIDPRNGGYETIEDVEAQHGSLASDVMQFTQGGGEHRIFKLATDANINLPGKLGPGVDVKRNGCLVLAPTAGVSGQHYEWEASSDPLEGVIPSPLPDWLRNLAHVQPVQTDRPASRFVTADQIDEIKAALEFIQADYYHDWIRIGMALSSIGGAGFCIWDEWSRKSPKYHGQEMGYKWRSFRNSGINIETIFFMAQERGWTNPLAKSAQVPEAVPVETIRPVKTPEISTTPEYLLHPPGVLGQVAQWIGATSRKPQPQFDVQAAIAFCAAVMGRRYCTTQRNWPSLYLLNIGKSASGKEHGKWAVENLLEACGMTHLIGPSSYTSNSGVLSSIHRQPSHITIIDEFGKVLEAASIKHSARAASAMVALMEAWGRCDGSLRPQGYSTFGMTQKEVEKVEDRTVRNPALTLLAMTTPESFFETIGSAAARDGFLNRFIIVESDIGRQAGKSAMQLPVPETIIEWAKDTHSHHGLANPDMTANLAAVPKLVPFSEKAEALFNAFEHECVRLMDDHEDVGLSEMFGRSNEIAMRLALIVAVSSGMSEIGDEPAKWAIDYVRHYTLRTVKRLQTSVADSEFEAVKKQVLGLIIQAGENGLAEWELDKKSSKFRALDKRGQISVLDSLAFVSKIKRVNISRTRGPARTAWIAIDPESENLPKHPETSSGGITKQ